MGSLSNKITDARFRVEDRFPPSGKKSKWNTYWTSPWGRVWFHPYNVILLISF